MMVQHENLTWGQMLIINLALHHVALIPLHLVLEHHLLLEAQILTKIRKLHLIRLRFDLVLLLTLGSDIILSIYIS